jgi:hypothetical protein
MENLTIQSGFIAAHSYRSSLGQAQLARPTARPLAGPCQRECPARTACGHHAWPRPGWHHGELFEGKRSPSDGLHMATQEPRRGGREGMTHRSSCSSAACGDDEEAPEELSRRSKKWSGRSSLFARNSWRG